jgi:hypothetical protein
MAARAYTLTQAAAAKRLSDVYGDGAGVVNAANDIPYRQVILQAEGAVALIGNSAVATTDYGFSIAAAASVVLGPFETGPIKLSDLYMVGTVGANNKLHILGIPY